MFAKVAKSSFCAIKPTCYSGIENTRRAPAVYVVSTFTVPCIWSAIIRQMLSPNPVPCTNESNLVGDVVKAQFVELIQRVFYFVGVVLCIYE